MPTYLAVGLLVVCGILFALHLATAVLTIRRLRRSGSSALLRSLPAVSIVRPVSGLAKEDEQALRSAFSLDYPTFEIIICAEREQDPATAFCRSLIAEFPTVAASLLVGRTSVGANPKLDNVEKGWNAARHPWVIMADCNVLMPRHYVQTMLAGWRDDCGLVCAPPVGIQVEGFWSELECGFLNTYQARWQLAADSVGLGFAQGKSMLWNRAFLDANGGTSALSSEIAEDAAATKLVRERGLRVRLADRPSVQPMGRRDFQRAWNRQLRWAQLRRQSFPLEFALEPMTSGLVAIIGAAMAVWLLSGAILVPALAGTVFWYGIEAILALRAGWPATVLSPFAWVMRDMLIPIIWSIAWVRQSYVWNGKAVVMSTDRPATQL